jgi:RHS repeat-associated protein
VLLTHDACGRLIERTLDRDGFRPQRWTYAWDVHDRLVSSSFLNGASETETWTFTYDPFGRRITKVRQLRGQERERANLLWPQPEGRTDTPQVGTFFLWDGDQLTAEAPLHLGGHVEWGKSTQWLYADEGSHTPIAKRLPDGTTLSIVSDHLGTPKEMFDGKGNLVWAADHHVWGAVRSVRASGALALKPAQDSQPAEHHCPFRFPGQYEDIETGLYYNRHRHYDPLTGQYASPDPIGLAGGDRPQGYVGNPGVWVDPFAFNAVTPTYSPYVSRLDPKTGGPMAIDTSKFTSGPATEFGGIRNSRQFWNEWQKKYPETISEANAIIIKNRGAPQVDATWMKHFPETKGLDGTKLIHHHINQGPLAMPLPEPIHSLQPGWGIWHPNYAVPQ